jgi:hypothetical protein
MPNGNASDVATDHAATGCVAWPEGSVPAGREPQRTSPKGPTKREEDGFPE